MIERSLQPTIGTKLNVDVISGLKASWVLLPHSVFAIKVDMILSEAHKTDSCNFFRNVQVRIRYAGIKGTSLGICSTRGEEGKYSCDCGSLLHHTSFHYVM